MKKGTILKYPAVFEPAKEGGYNVFFPNFPGCVTFGQNFKQAKEKAKEILELWLKELAETGEKITTTNSHLIIDDVKVTVPTKAKISYAPHHS